jgi:hypothetical protein
MKDYSKELKKRLLIKEKKDLETEKERKNEFKKEKENYGNNVAKINSPEKDKDCLLFKIIIFFEI